jgi:hypothetical protein
MDMETVAVKLEAHDHEIGSLKYRMADAEKTASTTQQLATSIAVLVEQIKTMNVSLNTLTTKVEALEDEPRQKWRFVVEKSIYFVVGAVIAFILGNVGI